MGKHTRTSYRGHSTKVNRYTGGDIGTAWNTKGAQKKRAFGGDGGEQEPRPRLQLLDVNGEVVSSPHTLNWPLAQSEASGNLWTEPVPFDEDNFGWKIYDTNNARYLDKNNYAVVIQGTPASTRPVGSRAIPIEKPIYYYLFHLDDAPSGDGDITEEEKSLALDTAERVLKYKDFYAPVVTWANLMGGVTVPYEKYSGEDFNTEFNYGDEFWAQDDLNITYQLTYNGPQPGTDEGTPVLTDTDDASIKAYLATAGRGVYMYKVIVKDKYGYANQLNMETVLTKKIIVMDTITPVIEVTMKDQDIEVGGDGSFDYGTVKITDGTLSTDVNFGISNSKVHAVLGELEVKAQNGLVMGTLTVALINKDGEAVDSIDTSTVGDVYEVKFDFTDGKNDAVPITRTITIIAEAPEPSDYSLLVGGKSEDDADMLIVYNGADGSIKVTKAPFLTDGAEYHLNGLSFVLPLEDLADGVDSGSTQDTSAQNAFAKFDDLINYRDSKSKGAKFTNISTGESPATFGANRAVITQKYQFPIIPKREGGAIMEIKNGEEDWTGDKLDVNNITAGKTKREMHLVLAQQIGGLALTKSNIDKNYTLGDPLWTHTSQLALQNADNGTNGPKTLAINAALMPVTRPGYPYVIDTAHYAKPGNEQPAAADIGKPWKPSRKELLKFFGWQEAAIDAEADGEVKDFSLDAWQWMADTDTNVPGIGVLGQNGRSKELRGHIRMGSVKPSNGAKFAVENNAVVGIDIGGGHIIERKEKDDQAFTLQQQGVAAALQGGEATKFYSAIGRIAPTAPLFLPTGNTAGTDTAIFYNVAFNLKIFFYK